MDEKWIVNDKLSVIEQKLYDYIKEKGQVSYNEIKKNLGEKYLGASGKLIQKELVKKSKRPTGEKVPTGWGTIGTKYEKILKLKEE